MTTVAAMGSVQLASPLLQASGPKTLALLPEPNAGAPVLDQLSILYLFHAKEQQLGLAHGQSSVKAMTHERSVKIDESIKEIDKALAEAREAEEHHSFWDSIGDVLGTVAKVAGVVASIALAVCTCGAATPIAALAIAGAVLSTASFVDSELHVLEKLGVDPEAAGWIDFGMSVGGAACSGGATMLEATSSLAGTATFIAKTTEAGAHVVRAVDAVEQSQYRGREEDDYANALADQKEAARLQQRLFALIDDLKADTKAEQRQLGHVQGIVETNDAALNAAVMRA